MLLAKLGRGGMGEVWRAYDTETARTVAIKLLPQHLIDDPVFQERFRREARIVSSLNEPHVVPIHHFGEINGRLYVDMRLIDGPDLATMLAAGPLSPPRAVTIIDGIASALNAAHRVGLVHRDVKPSNILVVDDDFAYLIDFGIARAASDGSLTSTGAAIGTWAYMAPERFQSGEADPRSDTYALACVLHQALTGVTPFFGNSAEQQIAGHLTQPPPRPSYQVPGLPPAMDDVIAIGMAKNPNERYSSTRAFAQAARAALSPAPPTRPSIDLGPSQNPWQQGPVFPSAATQYGQTMPPPWQQPGYPGAPTVPPNFAAPKRSRATVPLLIGGVVVLVVAVVAAVVLVSNRDSNTTTASSSLSTVSSPRSTTTSTPAPGQYPTIADYIKDNAIKETAVKDGDPGAPKVDLPIPDGWEPGGDRTPNNAYGSIFYKGPNPGDPPPRVVAIFSKLTGDVESQRILDLASGELNNLPGFTSTNEGQKTTLSGYPAYQLGGTAKIRGVTQLIAQKTVVIPVTGALYVLQLNAYGNEGQDAIVGAVTSEIDAKTKITV